MPFPAPYLVSIQKQAISFKIKSRIPDSEREKAIRLRRRLTKGPFMDGHYLLATWSPVSPNLLSLFSNSLKAAKSSSFLNSGHNVGVT